MRVSTPTHVLGADGGISEQDLRWVSNAITALQCMEMTGGARSRARPDGRATSRSAINSAGRSRASRPPSTTSPTCGSPSTAHAWRAYQAAWWVGRGDLAEREVAIAKLKCNEAYKRTTLDAHQLHGGMGYLRETDLHLWSERAKVTELLGGSWDVQIRRIEQALGLAG